ncbi:MAG: hypothetical protein JST92_25540 [Deltaproteobacteria bacterium]|nr:hypothetical protein [Deltaproteobacteria bacterium]
MEHWIHRISMEAAGDPTAPAEPEGAEVFRVLRELRKPIVAVADRTYGADAEAFLRSEILEHGRLRAGWGVPGLDLTKASFRDNVVVALRRYWDLFAQDTIEELGSKEVWDEADLWGHLQPFYEQASGRYKVLKNFQQMARHHVVFLPHLTSADEFSVARIDDTGYRFEDRSNPAATKLWELDFGHLRKLRDLKPFKFGDDTLPKGVFGGPYKNAIDKVKAKKAVFEAFVAAHHPK